MDPNANLIEQRQLAVRILRGISKKANELETDATRLAELVEAMDNWLSYYGIFPNDWMSIEQASMMDQEVKCRKYLNE